MNYFNSLPTPSRVELILKKKHEGKPWEVRQ
jgi:hypothetical protein